MIQARDVTAELPNTCCMEELRPWQGAAGLSNPDLSVASHSVTNAVYTCKLLSTMSDILDAMYAWEYQTVIKLRHHHLLTFN